MGRRSLRGGRLHNLLVSTLEAQARKHGFWTRTEAFLGSGFGDLVVGQQRSVILIEVELSPRRASMDIEKAERIGAEELWIVGSNRRVAKAISDRVGADKNGSGTRILVLVQPEAITRLAELGGNLDRDE